MTAHRRAAGLFLAAMLLYGCGESGNDAAGTAAPVESTPEPAASVESSGKTGTELGDVPREVIEAAHRVRPGLAILGAEYETRDGREYYDLAGVMPDDREIELDMTRVDGSWTVVEIQRDIGYPELPRPVADTLAAAMPGWRAERIIESGQGEGTVIYEFFGPGAGGERIKYEVKWADNSAELLTEEWAH